MSRICDVDTLHQCTVDQLLVCKASLDHAHEVGLTLRSSHSILNQDIVRGTILPALATDGGIVCCSLSTHPFGCVNLALCMLLVVDCRRALLWRGSTVDTEGYGMNVPQPHRYTTPRHTRRQHVTGVVDGR